MMVNFFLTDFYERLVKLQGSYLTIDSYFNYMWYICVYCRKSSSIG